MQKGEHMKGLIGITLCLLPAFAQATEAEATYRIPFFAAKSELGPMGKASIQNAAYELKNAERILIQGRPDPSQPENSDLAMKRALAVKKALVLEGIQEQKIQLEGRKDAIGSDKPSVYMATIVANRQANTPALFPVQQTTMNTPPVMVEAMRLPMYQEPMVPVSAVKRILKTAMEDNLSASATNRLFDLMVSFNTPAPATPVEPEKIKPVFIGASSKPMEWKVDANKSLRENITAWAVSSGWSAPEWLASEEYKAAKTTYIEGEFPDVLKQVSDSSGLNICVTRNPKNIKITDHNISCKD